MNITKKINLPNITGDKGFDGAFLMMNADFDKLKFVAKIRKQRTKKLLFIFSQFLTKNEYNFTIFS